MAGVFVVSAVTKIKEEVGRNRPSIDIAYLTTSEYLTEDRVRKHTGGGETG